MKQLTNVFQNGNLTPKERYLLLIQNDVIKENTGTEVLSEADKKALENWQAKTSGEVREWNTYNEGWKLGGRMSIEAALTYEMTKVEHFRKFFINFNLNIYPLYHEQKRLLERLEKIKTVDSAEAAEIVKKQRDQKLKDGMDIDYAVYRMAFESFNDEDKKHFIELYPDIVYDHSYLDEEEIIADLFKHGNKLTEKETRAAKEKLAKLVSKKSYNSYAKQYQLYHYFACIPLAEVMRYFLVNKGITISGKSLAKNQETDDEDSATHDRVQLLAEQYATEHDMTIEAMLKAGCLTWLDGDLFDQYAPLVFSNEKELLDRWIQAKKKARTILQKLVDKDMLKINHNIITGESLYKFKENYTFVTEFKSRVDTYDANLGIVYADDDTKQNGEHLDQELLVSNKTSSGDIAMFSLYGMTTRRLSTIFEATQFIEEVEENGELFLDFNHKTVKQIFIDTRQGLIDGYAQLLAFRDMFKKLSAIFETDVGVRANTYVEVIGGYIDDHNHALRTATGEQLSSEDTEGQSSNWFTKRNEVIQMKDGHFIDKDNILPDQEIVDRFITEFREIFGSGEF